MSEPNARLRRRLDEAARARRATATSSTAKMWITNGGDADTWSSTQRPTTTGAEAASRPSSSRRACRASRPRQKLDKLGMRGSEPCIRCSSTTARCRKRTCSGGVRRAGCLMSGLDYERAVLSRPAARHHGPAWTSGRAPRARAQTVRPGHRRVPADAGQDRRHVPTWQWRAGPYVYARRPGVRPPGDQHDALVARMPPGRDPVYNPIRRERRRGWPAKRSRRWAATATRQRIPDRAPVARRQVSTRSAPAPARSAAC